MKKACWIIRVVIPVIFILLLMNLKNSSVKLCSVDFDNREIVFYYDSSQESNDGLYFQIEGQPYKYLHNHIVSSKDQSVFFYVLYGEYQDVLCEGLEIKPEQVIQVQVNDKTKNINIYILDASKEYALVASGEEKGYILKSGYQIFENGIICSDRAFSSTNSFLEFTEHWNQVDSPIENTDEMETFLVISENWTKLNSLEGSNDWIFTRSVDENGDWLICVDDGNKTFYSLKDEEMNQLEQELRKILCQE